MTIEQLIEALARPGVLPGGGDDVPEVVQTHISAVFLAGERAYKLKKPVDFGFLDFSTREKRAHFAREELRLNRRLAPDVYLGLSPVRFRGDGGVEVGEPVEEPGEADELLVAMVRLPRERMMDRLLAEGRVEIGDVERIGRQVAAFHARAATGPGVDEHGTREAAGRLALENFDQTEGFRGSFFDPDLHGAMRRRTAGFLETRGRLFEHRVRHGRIRDGHGDLHSPNICLLPDGRPVIYDCIEFSPAYRCGDVASEVAFLSMDLEWRGYPDLARAFVRAYLAQAEDRHLEALLPFYQAYRAMVRAKVSALTASAEEVDPAVREASGHAARTLFALAEAKTRGLHPPTLVVLGGLTGVGKSRIAEELRERAGLVPLETDRIRKHLAGLDPEAPAPAAPGEGIYTPEMTRATYLALAREAGERLDAGESALAVGTFTARWQREELRRVAEERGVPFLFARLEAPDDVVLARLRAREPGVSDGNEEVWRRMRETEEPPEELPVGELLRLDTTGEPGTVAERILERLRAPFEGKEGS